MIQQRVVAYVKGKGIKQVYLSEQTGLSPAAISSIMNFKREIEVDEYAKLCEALEVPFGFFYSGHNDPPDKVS